MRALDLDDVGTGPLSLRPDDIGAGSPITPFQLDASAKAPCTSTIVGLPPACPDWSVAVTGNLLQCGTAGSHCARWGDA